MVLTTPTRPHTATAASTQVLSIKERRRRRRAPVPQMYSAVMVRILSERAEPIEGYAVDVSESGLCVELDRLIPTGSAVTIEFCVPGLGRQRASEWPMFVATAEVTRHDNLDDFPGGPYRTALRFIRIPTIVQAQIARYIATREPTNAADE